MDEIRNKLKELEGDIAASDLEVTRLKNELKDAKEDNDEKILALRNFVRLITGTKNPNEPELPFNQGGPAEMTGEAIPEQRQLPAHDEPHGVTIVAEDGTAEHLEAEGEKPSNVLTLPDPPRNGEAEVFDDDHPPKPTDELAVAASRTRRIARKK